MTVTKHRWLYVYSIFLFIYTPSVFIYNQSKLHYQDTYTHMCLRTCVSVCECICVCVSRQPHRHTQATTQGQFLNDVQMTWIQNVSSLWLAALPRLKEHCLLCYCDGTTVLIKYRSALASNLPTNPLIG